MIERSLGDKAIQAAGDSGHDYHSGRIGWPRAFNDPGSQPRRVRQQDIAALLFASPIEELFLQDRELISGQNLLSDEALLPLLKPGLN